ncbi:MAG: PKD domain-containing protein, partial [Thermoplasmatales archaeon]
MQKPLLKKGIAVAVIVLFIGMSVIPSTGNIVEEVLFNTHLLDEVGSSEEMSVRVGIAYGFCYNLLNGIVVFDLDDPGNLTLITTKKEGSNFFYGACFGPPNYWYNIEYGSGILWFIEMDTWKFMIIGGGGESLNDLAWDPTKGILYGTTCNVLFKIYPETGKQLYIGQFGSGPDCIMGIGCNMNGTLYGVDSGQDKLWTIDTDTGEATEVGPLGVDVIYCEVAYDKDNDKLYIVSHIKGELYICNTITGECTLIGMFQNDATIESLVIPYNFTNKYPMAKLTWTPTHPDPDETVLFNASKSYDPDGYIALYEWDWDNDGVYDENHTSPTATYSWSNCGLYPVALRITDNSSINGTTIKIVRVGNQPPDAPNITGPHYGRPGVEYTFCINGIVDPEGDDLYCLWDWGDGNFSGWLGPYGSGGTMCASHAWSEEGEYEIRVKTKDIHNAESDWSEPHVIMIEAGSPHVEISRPKKAVYIRDKKIIPFIVPVIFGDIQIWFWAEDNESGLNRTELYIDDELKGIFTSIPKSWLW